MGRYSGIEPKLRVQRLGMETSAHCLRRLEIKLRVAMIRNPNATGRNIRRAAKRHKRAGHLFAIAGLVLDCLTHRLEIAARVDNVFAKPSHTTSQRASTRSPVSWHRSLANDFFHFAAGRFDVRLLPVNSFTRAQLTRANELFGLSRSPRCATSRYAL